MQRVEENSIIVLNNRQGNIRRERKTTKRRRNSYEYELVRLESRCFVLIFFKHVPYSIYIYVYALEHALHAFFHPIHSTTYPFSFFLSDGAHTIESRDQEHFLI